MFVYVLVTTDIVNYILFTIKIIKDISISCVYPFYGISYYVFNVFGKLSIVCEKIEIYLLLATSF